MEAGLRQLGGIENIKINVETKHVQFNFDAKKHSLQELLKAIEGESGRFSARLLLQFKSKSITEEDFLKLKNALVRIKGVRSVGEPDKSRTIMITLKKDERTFLQEILDTSEKVGIPLQNPIKEEKLAACNQNLSQI
ncbi:MAG TPA: hypothetical protein VNK96_05020 [Fimbriimonadales bacterium]|nr:hypothetical protein [Fimbriimonadales bacterium]